MTIRHPPVHAGAPPASVPRWLRQLAWLLVFATAAAHGQGAEPDELVRGVTDEVLTVLRQDKDLKAGDRARAIRLIDEKIAPHFDFARMTALAVGPPWRQASPPEREALTREFRTLLVRTYANALTAYRDQTVHFPPSPQAQGDDVVIRSQIRQSGAAPIGLDYRLRRGADGWKVFDVAVDSVSLVTSYRGSFAAELAKGGPQALIDTLREQNRRYEPERPPS